MTTSDVTMGERFTRAARSLTADGFDYMIDEIRTRTIDETGLLGEFIERPKRALGIHEAVAMMRAWAAAYDDDPPGLDYIVDPGDEEVVAGWIDYLTAPFEASV